MVCLVRSGSWVCTAGGEGDVAGYYTVEASSLVLFGTGTSV